jgi:hypothetical protein
MKFSPHPTNFFFIFVKEVVEKGALIEESMGIGNQILNRLRSVRMSEREEESAENRIRHCSSLKDCSETYMRVRIVISVTSVDVHCWKRLIAQIEWAQGVVFPLDGLVKVHH